MALTRLVLENYRCFSTHSLPFSRLTVMVGPNNAGKSTVIEALGLVAVAAARRGRATYVLPPEWMGDPFGTKGFMVKASDLVSDSRYLFHRYGDPPARIHAHFGGRTRLEVNLGPESQLFCRVVSDGVYVEGRAAAGRTRIPVIAVMPRVGPVDIEERRLTREHVSRYQSTDRAPLHFRNQLLHFADEFDAFAELAEQSWPGLSIQSFERPTFDDQILRLNVRDTDFVAEVAWMGHGLQMWLQIMWFLARTPQTTLVILDEPDIYMHADLQRRLIELVRDRFAQTIIATHSVDIVSSVDPENVLRIEKGAKRSVLASDIPEVQDLVNTIGSVHNIQLARMLSAEKCLVVEGKDVALLRSVQRVLYPRSRLPLDMLPSWSTGGWGGWSYLKSWAERARESGSRITVYSLFDRDYHADAEIERRYGHAVPAGVQLHIWSRKEIENYFLIPETISRVASAESGKELDPGAVQALIDEASQAMFQETLDALCDEYQQQNRSCMASTARRTCQPILESFWGTFEERIQVVSGKRLLSSVSSALQARCGVSVSANKIGRFLLRSEIHPELAAIVDAIENKTQFRDEPALSSALTSRYGL
ncbi:MAG: ATP-dependent nuclease [Coriobacteriia bacterium]